MNDTTDDTVEVKTLADLEFPVIEFSVTDAALARLEERFKDLPDAETEEGYNFIKDGIKELTSLRTATEGRRKDLTSPALKWQRDVKTEGDRIQARIKVIEKPMREKKDAVDEKRQQAALEAARKEEARKSEIQGRIDDIKRHPTVLEPGKTAADYERLILLLQQTVINEETFAEFADDAKTARAAALYAVTGLLDDARQKEIDDKKRAEEQAEIDRKKKEQDDRQAELDAQQAEIDKQKEAAEERENEEQRKKDEANQNRVDAIKQKISQIKDFAAGLEDRPSADLETLIRLLKEREPVATDFEEFAGIAQQTWVETLAVMNEALEQAVEAETRQQEQDEARRPDRDKLAKWMDSIEAAVYALPDVKGDVAVRFVNRNRDAFKKLIDRGCDVVSKM